MTFEFGSPDDLDEARRRYRKLAQELHPDAGGSHEAMAELNAAWDKFKFGAVGTFTIVTKKRSYTVEPLFARNLVCNSYPCSWEDGETRYGYLKLPRSPRDNDLVAAEVKALKKLDKLDPRYRAYVPLLIESFRHKDSASHTVRQAVVTERIPNLYSLADVRSRFPHGVDSRDVAWMWRRVLAGIGAAHQCGVIHGALTPENILIEPDQHGVVFVNWEASVSEPGGHVPLRDPRLSVSWYPLEVTAKTAATPATDIYMLTRSMEYLLGGKAPVQIRAFIRGCTVARPTDAWAVKDDYDQLIERLYGPRKFRPFTIPNK